MFDIKGSYIVPLGSICNNINSHNSLQSNGKQYSYMFINIFKTKKLYFFWVVQTVWTNNELLYL